LDHSCQAGFPGKYDRDEVIADGVIHTIGICFGLIGTVIIIIIASHSTKMAAIASVLIYAAALVAMLGFSAAYNMWPVSRTKWIFRRSLHFQNAIWHAFVLVAAICHYTAVLEYAAARA